MHVRCDGANVLMVCVDLHHPWLIPSSEPVECLPPLPCGWLSSLGVKCIVNDGCVDRLSLPAGDLGLWKFLRVV